MVAFGKSVPDWPAFPDTVQALQDLREMGYTLVVLSNVDRESFNGTVKKQFGGLGTSGMGPFGAILTAEEIGSYKPDVRNFLYLKQKAEKKWGWGTGEILHVAQSLFHDHVPAKGLGWWTCWVRRGAAEMGGKGMGEDPLGNGLKWDWKVESLGGLVEVMRKEKREVDLTGEGK